jgi:hypothetical protein
MSNLRFVLAVASLALSAYPARAVPPDTLASTEEAAATVVARNLDVRGGVVSGVLVNNSRRLLRDVRLLVRHTWLWKDERAPRRDNPGRSEYYTVAGDLPAGGTLPFRYQPAPPLPARADGHFETSVEVVGFTEVGE